MARPSDRQIVTGWPKPRISLVVLDFDDTLYDWIGHFVPALEAMIKTAAPILDVGPETLRDELRKVHRRYQNTEHPFALLETVSVEARFGHLDRVGQRAALAPAFEAFDRVRAERLRLYDDAVIALDRLRAEGIPRVGYTAATSANIAKRIKLLGLEDAFACVYAAAFKGKPYPGSTRSGFREPSIIELPTPKPHPYAITRIITDFDVPLEEALFVGDSFTQDIEPALSSGARAAWVRRVDDSAQTWLPSLLEITHRETAPGTVHGAALGGVPVVSELTQLWQHFDFIET